MTKEKAHTSNKSSAGHQAQANYSTKLDATFHLQDDGGVIREPVIDNPFEGIPATHDSPSISLGFYDTHNSKTPTKHLSLDSLVELIKNPYTRDKANLPLITPFDGVGKTKEAAHTANYWAAVTDHDGVEQSITESITKLSNHGYNGALLHFTTSSHGSTTDKDGKPKPPNHYKFILPFDRPTDAETAHKVSTGLNLLLGADIVQGRVQQGFYAPNSKTQGLPYEGGAIRLDGGFLTPDCGLYKAALARFEQEQQKHIEAAQTAAPKPRALALTASDDRIIDLINGAYDMAAILKSAGHRPRGRAYLSPHSKSGAAGGYILPSGRFFSYHGAACPLSRDNHTSDKAPDGHSLDVADVLCFTRYGGDFAAMIREQAELLDPDGQAQRQRDHAIAKAEEEVTAKLTETEERDAVKAATEGVKGAALPPIPPALANLPDGLGEVQKYIYGTMTHPCMYTAGWTAIATFAGIAQTHVTIDMRRGLGLNEYYLTLAPTGFGKEELRDPLNAFIKELEADFDVRNSSHHLPAVEFSAPSSKQGLHQIIEQTENHSIYMQSDEFAEWLKVTNRDPHKAGALAYLMEIYSKALRSIHPGRAVTAKYETVHNPRLGAFATTTAESLLTSLSKEAAEMGAYNRWVVYVAPEQIPQKRYAGMKYDIPPAAYEAVKWVVEIDPKKMQLEHCAFKAYVRNDERFAEPIRQTDALLGGRLSEQAIKMAGLFALSAKRSHILACDIDLAYQIRLGLYHRAKAMIDESGAVSGNHESGKALEQLSNLFKKNESVYISQLAAHSRAFKGLSVMEQKTVIDALLSRGIAAKLPNTNKVLISQVYGEP